MRKARKGLRGMIADERGIALAMILVLSAITLGIMSGLLYMITIGTQMSGVSKRYKTAYEASLGGVDVMHEIIGFRGNEGSINTICTDTPDEIPDCKYETPVTCAPDPKLECAALNNYDPNYTKLQTKLNLPTDCWSGCDSDLTIDHRLGFETTYDIHFTLGADPDPVYNVYAKIVDATEGNSGSPSEVVEPCGVAPGCNDAQVPQIVYLYTLEVLVQSATNPLERAKTATLFAY
jgi:hypothetical protein